MQGEATGFRELLTDKTDKTDWTDWTDTAEDWS